MRNIHLRYVKEKYDKKGILSEYKMICPPDFNFAFDVVDDIGINDPKRRALVWADVKGNTRTLTFGEMKKYSDKAANYFLSLGIKKGDAVLIALKNHYQFWYVLMALHKIGALGVPGTFMLKKHDIEYRVNAASIKAVMCVATDGLPEAVDSAENIPTLKLKIMLGGAPRSGWHDLDEGIEKASDVLQRVPSSINDPMLMYFSSGTTGLPKMVLYDHTYAIGHISTAKHWHDVVPDGLHLTIADTGWAKVAWGKLYGQWFMEAGIFVYDYEKFVPADVLNAVSKYKVTTLCCPPTMFRMFLNDGDVKSKDLSCLKHATIAGEALNPDIFHKWYEATGLKLMEGYGQTETTLTVCNTKGMEPRPGSMGKPNPQYVVDIIDADGNSCAPGVTGEIVVGADPPVPGLMVEYYRDPDKTSSTVYGGWHHTGDVAWRDEDGYIWYVGRNDDIIKSSGYRIGPFEIESVLAHHPAVRESAVTGVPDEVRGQLVKATIVLREGYEPSDALKKDIQDFVKRETAPYKYPRVVEFVKILPKTLSGKIRRVEIREGDKK
ncbi:MAG: AMP-binding protein [Methanomassiliicoccaceae archaeon]|jgi:acetyl-CoA synthetase|nr:AMP-binding protein [Methanomassiliicoccaceae archaeon]